MAVKLAMIFFSMILVNNYVLVQFLGKPTHAEAAMSNHHRVRLPCRFPIQKSGNGIAHPGAENRFTFPARNGRLAAAVHPGSVGCVVRKLPPGAPLKNPEIHFPQLRHRNLFRFRKPERRRFHGPAQRRYIDILRRKCRPMQGLPPRRGQRRIQPP